MLTAGWNAHTLNAPGKFLISAAGHDTPRRARAYLVTDQAVADTADRYAYYRPPLDEASRQALGGRDDWGPPDAPGGEPTIVHDADEDQPEAILWAALSLAPDDGITVPELMEATGMSRPWIYLRLRELADLGQVIQVSRGRWRAVIDDAS
jgi:S-DNA-T family DNA segregation ATPase FtsK/SpoIIIE